MKKILVIEDEESIQELLRYNLEIERYSVVYASTGEEGIELFKKENPNLILLDIMLPGMNGIEVLKTIRSSSVNSEVPIIMLTAKGEESDVILGLELGADDYVLKPFSLKILLARIKKVLQLKKYFEKTKEDKTKILSFPNIYLNPNTREVKIMEKDTKLTSSEFDALYYLASNPNFVYTRNQIISAVHGQDYFVTHRSIDVLMVSLRKKLGEMGKTIETVRGVGYKFSIQDM